MVVEVAGVAEATAEDAVVAEAVGAGAGVVAVEAAATAGTFWANGFATKQSKRLEIYCTKLSRRLIAPAFLLFIPCASEAFSRAMPNPVKV